MLFLNAAASPADARALLDESIAAFERALALEPGHVDALYNGAVALEAAGGARRRTAGARGRPRRSAPRAQRLAAGRG